MTHIIFFDRDLGKLEGRLTLQRIEKDGTATPIFKQLPVRSGQFPFLDGGADDWVKGKGATPIGQYWLSTKKEVLQMEPKGTPFFVISDKQGERVIRGPHGEVRGDIGLHMENQFPGSAGCVVLLVDTPARYCLAMAAFAYLEALYKYEKYVRFVVT